jgi:cell division protein FtsL
MRQFIVARNIFRKDNRMPDQNNWEEQATKQINDLFAVVKKHGKYMVGGLDFQSEIRETIIGVAQTITNPLEARIGEQEREIQELHSIVNELKLRIQ